MKRRNPATFTAGPATATQPPSLETDLSLGAGADKSAQARPPLYADPERERLFREWQAGLRRRAMCARRLDVVEDDRPRYGDDLARRDPWLRSA